MQLTEGDLFAPTPADMPQEVVELLHAAGPVRVERICSRGHTSPEGFWYDQDHDEWVALLSGEAVVEYDGSIARRLRAGEWLLIRAHQRHRVSWTAPDRDSIWLAVHFPASEA